MTSKHTKCLTLVLALTTLLVISMTACQLVPTTPTPTPFTPAIPPVPPAATIAEVRTIGVSVRFLREHPYYLFVELEPTTSALADRPYLVELYEKGHLRATTTVTWNQPEINVLKAKRVLFPITTAEYDAYFFENVRHIFSIEVHE